jgi:hypothetical protein
VCTEKFKRIKVRFSFRTSDDVWHFYPKERGLEVRFRREQHWRKKTEEWNDDDALVTSGKPSKKEQKIKRRKYETTQRESAEELKKRELGWTVEDLKQAKWRLSFSVFFNVAFLPFVCHVFFQRWMACGSFFGRC